MVRAQSAFTINLNQLVATLWQHVLPADRQRAFRKLITLMKPGALIVLSLREGPAPSDRPMVEVSLGEIEVLARLHGLELLRAAKRADGQGRSDIGWTHVVLKCQMTAQERRR